MWLNVFSRNNLKQNIPQARSLNWNVSIKNCALAIFVFIFLNNRSRAYAWRIYTILNLLYKQENQGYGYYYRVEVPTSIKHNVTFLLYSICLPTFARISAQITTHELIKRKIYSQKTIIFIISSFACCFTKSIPNKLEQRSYENYIKTNGVRLVTEWEIE